MDVGRVLGKAYRVERALGAGGVGAVYEATQVRTGRRYAVKVLLPEIAMREGAAARFRREAEALAAVGHSGIVSIHDFDTEEDGTQFLVMDLLEGEDLATRLAREGALELPAALRILEEIGTALTAAHALGIVHRDLKPANVFLARRAGSPERAMILDFGLAKNLAGPSVNLTATGVGLGTPLYMSPEQARGEDVDLRTDVYSLGCILFEMLTASAPFTGTSIGVVIAKILTEEPPLVSAHARRPTPPALDEVVRMALAKNAVDRYANVRALIDAAHRAAGDSSERALAATAVLASSAPGGAASSSPAHVAPLAATTPAQALLPPGASTTPRSGPLPLTRDGIPAVPSIRPAPGQSTGTSQPVVTQSTTPSAVGQSAPWAWAAVGVLSTLLAGGAIAWLREPPIPPPTSSTPSATTTRELVAEPAPAPGPEAVTEAAPTTDTEAALATDTEAAPAPTLDQAIVPIVRTRPRPVAERTEPASQPPSEGAPVAAPAPVPALAPAVAPVPPPTGAALTPEQRALIASQSGAALRSYDAQIASNDRRIREYEALLPDVLELRRQSRLLARGDVPPACSSPLRQRLAAGARGDESLVASMSTMLEGALDPVCTAFESWAAPPPEVLQRFATVSRDLELAERSLDGVSRDAPPEQIETVRRALASVRSMHEAQPPTFARYPCRGPAMTELLEASEVSNGQCRAAADRLRRTLDRACTELGMSDRRLTQLGRTLSDRTDAAEQQLRQAIQMYTDLSTRFRAARAQIAGATQ